MQNLVDYIVGTLDAPPVAVMEAHPDITLLPVAPGQEIEALSRQSGAYLLRLSETAGIGAGRGGRPLAYRVFGEVVVRVADTGRAPHERIVVADDYGRAVVRALDTGGWQHTEGATIQALAFRDFRFEERPADADRAIEAHLYVVAPFEAQLRADGAA